MADTWLWARQRNMAGVGTSFRPSLCTYNGRLFAAWKGVNNDQGIYWSRYDGIPWTAQQHNKGDGTTNRT